MAVPGGSRPPALLPFLCLPGVQDMMPSARLTCPPHAPAPRSCWCPTRCCPRHLYTRSPTAPSCCRLGWLAAGWMVAGWWLAAGGCRAVPLAARGGACGPAGCGWRMPPGQPALPARRPSTPCAQVLWRNCGELVGKLGGSWPERRKQAQQELTQLYTHAGNLALDMQAPYTEGGRCCWGCCCWGCCWGFLAAGGLQRR